MTGGILYDPPLADWTRAKTLVVLADWRNFMKDPNAVKLGRKGGRARTVAKVEAARINGRKGGRPRGRSK